MEIPRYYELFQPTLTYLRDNGGSATRQELLAYFRRQFAPGDEALDVQQYQKLKTNVSFALTFLGAAGYVGNATGRGIWALLDNPPTSIENIDVEWIKKHGERRARKKAAEVPGSAETGNLEGEPWRQDVLMKLRSLDPFKFEVFVQRLLREAGFIEVQVTKKTGDGGIDGTGTWLINNLLSYRIIFQCKRYKDGNNVGAPAIRDLRGSIGIEHDKALFITTSTFTTAAREAAVEAGKKHIDLIDGDQLVELMNQLKFGVRRTPEVDDTLFDALT